MGVMQDWLQWLTQHAHSVEGVLLFICCYAVGTMLIVPASALTLLTGAVYGLPGLLVVLLGSSLGSGIAFVLGRKLLHHFVRRHFGQSRWLKVLQQSIEQNGLQMVILLRLAVFLPFGAVNYSLSITSLPLATFLLGSLLGTLLPSLLYIHMGSVAGTLLQALAQQQQHTPAKLALQLLGLFATLLLLWLMRHSSKQLRQLEQQASNLQQGQANTKQQPDCH
ncbi:MAG: VTT domain-containing protein [Myxococcota bacterium]